MADQMSSNNLNRLIQKGVHFIAVTIVNKALYIASSIPL